MPIPSQIQADEHRRHVAYHTSCAAEHDAAGEHEAAAKHQTAIIVHQAAMFTPLDKPLSDAAMRMSDIADEVSQRVGRDK